MTDETIETIEIRAQRDVAQVRRTISRLLSSTSARPTETTKFVTAASELARNTLIHGGGGTVTVELMKEKAGFRVAATFDDLGKGITDIGVALQDGYTSAGGLGLGLGGAKRLCDEFEVQSSPGTGTRVRISSRVGRR